MGTGGCLTSLARTRVGPFKQVDGWFFDRLTKTSEPENYLIELEQARAMLDPANIRTPARPMG